MDSQWLEERVAHLKGYLSAFGQRHQQLKEFYEQSLPHITDPEARSRFMEKYCIHVNRHQRAMQKLTRHYQQAIKRLNRLTGP